MYSSTQAGAGCKRDGILPRCPGDIRLCKYVGRYLCDTQVRPTDACTSQSWKWENRQEAGRIWEVMQQGVVVTKMKSTIFTYLPR